MFPVYAFPPAFAGSVIFALGLTSLLYARRDRINTSFALFCFAWTLVASTTLVLQLTGSLVAARLAPGAVWLTYVFMGLYIIMLTGRDRTMHAPMFGIRPDGWLAALGTLAVAGAAISATTDWVIDSLTRDPTWGYNLVFSPIAILLHAPFVILQLYGLSLLYCAWRDEPSPARRIFLRNNLVALVAMIASAALFTAVLPGFGLPTFALVFDAFALVAFFFFGIIANYGYQQVDELNAHLEEKVVERTRALEQAQARLVQAEKMVALGRLVAGVAHEINSPLGAVRSMQDTRAKATDALLANLRREGNADGSELERLERVLKNGDGVVEDGLHRIDAIVRRLKSFARLDESDLKIVDVNEALDEAIALLSLELNGTTIDRHFAATRKLTCMSRQVNQVFLNVLTNAAQAVEHDGTIRVETADVGDGIEIKILDDGPGIAPEHQPHVFDPGFTTKGVGVGTGMGLAIAYRVVDDHGGAIEINSRVGHGTCVTMRLPLKTHRRDQPGLGSSSGTVKGPAATSAAR